MSSGKCKIFRWSNIIRISDFSLFLTHFSRFLLQIVYFYVTATSKQHFLTSLRVSKGRRDEKWSFYLQNPSKSIKIIKNAHFWWSLSILKDFEGKMTIFRLSDPWEPLNLLGQVVFVSLWHKNKQYGAKHRKGGQKYLTKTRLLQIHSQICHHEFSIFLISSLLMDLVILEH